jgi:hypothetical protein
MKQCSLAHTLYLDKEIDDPAACALLSWIRRVQYALLDNKMNEDVRRCGQQGTGQFV